MRERVNRSIRASEHEEHQSMGEQETTQEYEDKTMRARENMRMIGYEYEHKHTREKFQINDPKVTKSKGCWQCESIGSRRVEKSKQASIREIYHSRYSAVKDLEKASRAKWWY